MSEDLSILEHAGEASSSQDGHRVVAAMGEVYQWVMSGRVLGRLWQYRDVELVTGSLQCLYKPFLSAALIRALGRRRCVLRDRAGAEIAVSPLVLAQLFAKLLVDAFRAPTMLAGMRRELAGLASGGNKGGPAGRLRLDREPVYLRTDPWLGVVAGGSVGHIAGVLNNLSEFTQAPLFLTSDIVPTVDPGIEAMVIPMGDRFWDYRELPTFDYNQVFYRKAAEILRRRLISFVYQRYSPGNYVGLKLACDKKVPLVLEYNGSVLWIEQNWGRGLQYNELFGSIEMANLRGADLVVVVSKASRDELLHRGIPAGKILVNPNGVDTGAYNPSLDGARIRKKYGLQGKTVFGFIGTFGKWHGVTILARAFAELVREHPDLKQNCRLMLIGDGMEMARTLEILEAAGVLDLAVITGLVPQEQGPEHLAACDVLVSPHVPNPDGTPFFGSPTKIFEYMAMGKPIVATDLDQIGEVLEHGRTAWLVDPGDSASLAKGLHWILCNGQVWEEMGASARREVAAKYTWSQHTQKIIQKLESLAL